MLLGGGRQQIEIVRVNGDMREKISLLASEGSFRKWYDFW
jgi:hypothetical protein